MLDCLWRMQRICCSDGEKHKKCERGEETIKVYGFRKEKQGIMNVENALKSEQEFVGGRIATYSVTDDFILIYNDDGFNDELEPRAVVLREGQGESIDQRNIQEIIHGDCFVCRFDGVDGFESINDNDVELIKHLVKKVTKVCGSVIEIEK